MAEKDPERLAGLRERMAHTDTDLVALGPGPHMDWLLGFHPHADERPSMLLVGRQQEAFLMPALNAAGSREHTDIAFHSWSDAQGPHEALRNALESVGAKDAKKVAVDESMRANFALLLLDKLPGTSRSYASETVGELRMRKNADELDALQENALIADKAMSEGFAALKAGMTEQDLAGVIRECFSRQGAQTLFTIVATGANGAYPHHQTGEGKISEGDAIVIDIGGKKGSYSSDITRMAVVGEPPRDYEKVHGVVEKAVIAALAAARPGVAAKDVDLAARNVIDDAGYGEYFVHRTGHGLGIEVHEPPYLTSTSDTTLEEGMVFSIEPGIYLPGKFGIRLEEIVALEAGGPRILSSLTREAKVIPA